MKWNHSIAIKGLVVLTILTACFGIWRQYHKGKNLTKATKQEVLSETANKQEETKSESKPATQTESEQKPPVKDAIKETQSKPTITQKSVSKNIPKKPVVQKTNTTQNPDTSLAGQIISVINQERAKNGLSAVVRNGLLDKASYLKSKDMTDKNYFAHTAPDGTSDVNFVNLVGYKYQSVGINLAEGNFASANELVQAWMDSPGHRKNVLAEFGKEIGIGIYGKYYTMMIGRQL